MQNNTRPNLTYAHKINTSELTKIGSQLSRITNVKNHCFVAIPDFYVLNYSTGNQYFSAREQGSVLWSGKVICTKSVFIMYVSLDTYHSSMKESQNKYELKSCKF